MSLIYDNIKHLCKANGVNLADIESPMKAGYISRYERRENILSLPLWIAIKVSKSCNVSIDDLVNKDIATDAKLKAVREEIERLKVVERTLVDTPQTETHDLHTETHECVSDKKKPCTACKYYDWEVDEHIGVREVCYNIGNCQFKKKPQTDCGWK